jgi:DNA-3-methyladenine glycosylase I
MKIEAAIQNARAFLEVQAAFGSFDAYIWRFVEGRPKQNAWRSVADLPAKSEESEALSRETSSNALSVSSARPSAMPTCRQPAW